MMKMDGTTHSSASDSGEEYEVAMLLDGLESLLEDVEEQEGQGLLPADLAEEMRARGLSGAEELRARIRSLHERFDAQEAC